MGGFTMAMIGYVARVLTGVRFKKMNHMIDVVHQLSLIHI